MQLNLTVSLKDRLVITQDELVGFCRRWAITEMALFGSVVRADFDSDSDVDVLVEFEPAAKWTLFDLVTMRDDLSTLLGRKVDLVERAAVERSYNTIRRKTILDSAQVVYVA